MKGEAYFEVSRDTTRHFTVRTADMDIEVYGTSFDVDAYEDNREVSATLTSGKIKARCQGREYDLVPGQQVRYDPATGKTKVEVYRSIYLLERWLLLFRGCPFGRYYEDAFPLV